MSILDPIKGFGVTFSTMFRPVVTEDYSANPAPTAPRYRMRHRLNRHPDGLDPARPGPGTGSSCRSTGNPDSKGGTVTTIDSRTATTRLEAGGWG